MNNFDIIVVGGGPSGSAAALFAARAGLKTLLLEKSIFPRDKTCGDAIGGKSIDILRKLNLINDIQSIPKVPTKGIVFSSPKGDSVSLRLINGTQNTEIKGFVCKRVDFDNFLFQRAKAEVALCLENFQTVELLQGTNGFEGIRGKLNSKEGIKEYRAKIVIGADGYKSFVSRQLGLYEYNSKHTLVAIRGYYEGVTEMSDFIEIHYVNEALPGYFWIFPLADGTANVGLGMRHIDIKERKVDLHQKLDIILHSNLFRSRFKNAKIKAKMKGWNLPIGSIFRKNHAAGVLLVGDAAGIVDPFSGEGIGNALTSADLAVQVAKKAIEKNDVSFTSLSEYDNLIKSKLGSELKLSYQLQQMIVKFPFLINLIIKKANNNKSVKNWLSAMVEDENLKKSLTNPLTYLKLVLK